MMEDNKIYLDKNGYEQLLAEIDRINQELSTNGKEKGEAYEVAGDGWHDNFAFEEASRQEKLLLNQLRSKYD